MTSSPLRIGAAGAAAGLALAGLAFPAVARGPQSDSAPKIDDVKLGGTGCSKDDTVVVLSNGNRAIEVLHSAFTVRAGLVTGDDGSTSWVPNATKNCQFNLKLTYDRDLTFALTEINNRGFYDLAAAAAATHIVTYYFAGMPQTGKAETHLKGPKTDTYDYAHPVATPNWSECGATRAFNLNSRVSVNASKAAKDSLSEVSINTADIVGGQRYRLGWRNC